MENIQRAIILKKELDNLRPINTEQENRIMQKFRLDWNYHSNHLEGNTLTYGETKALILFGVTAQGKPLKDTLEITGHNEAIDWVIDMVKGERPLTENFIRELHKMLLREPYEKKAISPDGLPTSRTINVGSYKTTPNHVLTATGETFYFATPEETPAKMHDLIEWYKEKKGNPETNPILLAAEFHYKFIRIHPFDDGNGRTARILMNFILMQYNYPPVIIKTQDKENYFGVLRMADAGNIEAFVNYIAENLNYSLEIMIAGAKGENIEEEDDLDKEIALLEDKLKKYNTKSKRSRTKEEIISVIDNSLSSLLTLMNEKSIVFNRMYQNNAITFLLKNALTMEPIGLQEFNNLDKCKAVISDITDSLRISLKYLGFNKQNFENFNYKSSIVFDFKNPETYIVNYYDLGKNIIIEKEYGNWLSSSEMNQIVKTQLKNHKQFIEQKIAEQENKH